MHFIAGFFLVILFFFLVGVIITFYYLRKGMKFMKRMASGNGMSDEEFRRRANKYYKGDDDGVKFDEDYFQGTSDNRNSQKTRQRRTTRTAGGVTIIDDRDPDKANKKIFAHDEGDYVDFTEN